MRLLFMVTDCVISISQLSANSTITQPLDDAIPKIFSARPDPRALGKNLTNKMVEAAGVEPEIRSFIFLRVDAFRFEFTGIECVFREKH